ncbi:OLC1v1019509C1 [Oldenlandia corymbosa var. corymbosa]|uniref:OLC1v1019509C1 n=1 Tax=Oldenlandia corymbosa var. corymbosa TaxID=529605 RepID=A0AAV1EE36_OLDCO|nr:OLC1v1019509C1 [Oldenlandia corymbosa var. corymbosa]
MVFGCSLAAITEVSFNFGGLWGAMISDVGFVLRNIYSKKGLQNWNEVDGLNLYGWIGIISFLYLFPVAIFVDDSQRARLQSSYQALDDISPLTFSVGNTMKRVVVIVATVLVFRNPVRPLNALGSAVAKFGTFLYSQATAKKPKKQA